MLSNLLVAITCLAPLALAQTTSNGETILGVYMFHRHGDRTAKLWPPANLTDLGYAEVYASGQYYRSRYIASDAELRIQGINSDLVKQSQIAVSAPADNVLMNSAQGFLQGLYPPVGSQLGSNTLRNGSSVEAPLNGYQLIPVAQLSTGGGSEDNTWLQSASGCLAATVSSNNFFTSAEYTNLLQSTQNFYQSILPVVNGSFSASADNFKNAYTIWDLINVAQIHNVTNYNSPELITSDVFHQLFTLANAHEWGLAYNASDDARAMAGKVLAGQILRSLNSTATSPSGSAPKINVQFGAYGTFLSFFGLAGLPALSADWTGIVDYASSMAFELFTNTTGTSTPDDMYVRFVFHNGTANATSPPAPYPLFGSSSTALRWSDFAAGMNAFAIGNTEQWCTACGNSTGTCAQYASGGSNSGSGSSTSASSSSSSSGGNGLSPAVNGVIGAMVTLAVVLAAILVFVVSGFRVVSKKRFAGANGAAPVSKVDA